MASLNLLRVWGSEVEGESVQAAGGCRLGTVDRQRDLCCVYAGVGPFSPFRVHEWVTIPKFWGVWNEMTRTACYRFVAFCFLFLIRVFCMFSGFDGSLLSLVG